MKNNSLMSETARSPFVEITTDRFFEVRMQYPASGMVYAEKQCFVRNEVYRRLLEAQSFLPDGCRLLIYDAWRPFRLQKELYDRYSDEIIRRYGLEGCDKKRQEAVIAQFVSVPTEDRLHPPVHTTGGAVDLTIIDGTGRELNMGCAFDEFGAEAHTAFFEDSENAEVRDNRRLLCRSMVKAGFTNLPSEWWHFDYGDDLWSFFKKTPALYPGCFSREEME